MLTHKKITSSRNKSTCACNTFIRDMLLESDLNKWWLIQLEKLDNLYINLALTGILKISNKHYIEYKNQIFSNNSHINIIFYNDASLYHCYSPIAGSKIPKWDCVLNFCAECPGMKAPYL